ARPGTSCAYVRSIADLVTKPRPAGFHHVTPVASSAMATPVAPMPFWRAPGWISRDRPVPCAKAVAARTRPSAMARTTVVHKRRMWWLLSGRGPAAGQSTGPGYYPDSRLAVPQSDFPAPGGGPGHGESTTKR